MTNYTSLISFYAELVADFLSEPPISYLFYIVISLFVLKILFTLVRR